MCIQKSLARLALASSRVFQERRDIRTCHATAGPQWPGSKQGSSPQTTPAPTQFLTKEPLRDKI